MMARMAQTANWNEPVPQASAEFYDFFDRSYNVPEFMTEAVKITPHEFSDVLKGESVNVKYVQNIK